MIWYLHVFVHINGAILATLRKNLSCCFRLLICTATGVFGSRDVWEWMATIVSDGLKEWMAAIVRRLQGGGDSNRRWKPHLNSLTDNFRSSRLKLKKQIVLFNDLLEHQYHVMKYPKVPLAPMQNGVHSMPAASY
ncbi:hypothetical protein CASFOL_023407 [Castilleja foliolosa]|uniref:Uncharacterized protein n=1 Tax=Castilleja foliolosa TaxID=1961234 RepID=A0ABD3CLC6_9LAMI